VTQTEIQEGASAESPYVPRMARIVSAEQMTETERFFRLEMEGEPLAYEPGQFVSVTVFGVGEAPMRATGSASAARSATRSPTRR